jgi:hypothetical protein
MAGRHIPFARNSSHFVHIQNNLAKVLGEIRSIPNLTSKPLWVSCRLNRTNKQDSPVFVGWVESIEAIDRRVQKGCPYAPIEIRFGDTHVSKLYTECLTKPQGEVVYRRWKPDRADPTSQEVGRNFYGETHRRSMPVKIGNCYAGTLNAAFLGAPTAANDRRIRNTLTMWAQTNSPLVRYIRDHLAFSGPKPPRRRSPTS